MQKIFRAVTVLVCMTCIVAIIGCGKSNGEVVEETNTPSIEENNNVQESVIDTETATDTKIDFDSLQAQNPDIFAWIRVPGTDIDYPILRSEEELGFYKNRDANKQTDANGSVYIERYNMPNMCDFNTIIHGSKELFGELVNFANPEYFEENDKVYIYLPDNVLTYSIWAVYERDNVDITKQYSFGDSIGAREFLNDVYNGKVVGKLIREDWEAMSEYNFLITLVIDDEDSDKQLTVIGAVVDDAAGTLNRDIVEEIYCGPDLFATPSVD